MSDRTYVDGTYVGGTCVGGTSVYGTYVVAPIRVLVMIGKVMVKVIKVMEDQYRDRL